MNLQRTAFLATSEVAIQLLASDEVAENWESPSALEEWSLKGLAGHLARATIAVEDYLDADPNPTGEPIDPATYYTGALDDFDVNSELNKGIRERGDEVASQGYEALLRQQSEVAARLDARLETEPDDRRIRVWKDFVLTLDDYLITRIIELTCHIDDVAVSVGIPTPALPTDALDLAIDALVAAGRFRHGDVAVLRALTRRERDEADALHVL